MVRIKVVTYANKHVHKSKKDPLNKHVFKGS